MDDGLSLNLNDLSLFVHVVDHAGFASAARALGASKSTLSKRVAELEKSLGARLIERSSRRFVVTDVGREFYRHAAAMLIEAEAARRAVQGRLAEPTGLVRMTASIPTAQFLLAPVLPRLALAWPKLKVAVHATDRFVDVVQDGFDIAIRDHFAALPDSELVQRRLGVDLAYLVAAPSYLACRGTPLSPGDLAEHDGLLTTPRETSWTLRHEDGSRAVASPFPRFIADEALVLLRAAEAGLGIVSLPSKLCRDATEAGSLVRVMTAWTAGEVTTSLLMPYRRSQIPAVRTVADFLLEHRAD